MTPRRATPRRKTAKRAGGPAATHRVTVENVNVPGYTVVVDGAKYRAMRRAMLKLLSREAPGLTQAEIRQALVTRVPKALFPDGGKVAWWANAKRLLRCGGTDPSTALHPVAVPGNRRGQFLPPAALCA